MEHFNFLTGQTVFHPTALVITLIAGILMLMLPRKYVILPLIVAAIFIPIQQRFVIFTLDFTILKILVMVGLLRAIMRSEYRSVQLNEIDKVMIWWNVAMIISYTLLRQTSGAFIYRLGASLEILGIYFLARFYIQEFQDIIRVIKVFAIICIPLAISMLIEHKTGRNLFAVFGGVPEITMIRDGRLRCQGAFAHPIMAGTFGASLLSLFIALWWRGRDKMLALIGIIASTSIMLTSSSSGPVLTYIAGIVALCMWPFRESMRTVRWGIALSLIALHIVMNAPVWALLMHVKVIGSSTAYHRYMLFDAFIKHIGEWGFLGTRSTAHWGHDGLNLWDVTNQYVRIGIDGGLVTLILFVVLIVFCFRGVGRALQIMENQPEKKIVVWALGASLFTHVVSFAGVSYFDQIIVQWYSLLAIISAISVISHEPFHTKSKDIVMVGLH